MMTQNKLLIALAVSSFLLSGSGHAAEEASEDQPLQVPATKPLSATPSETEASKPSAATPSPTRPAVTVQSKQGVPYVNPQYFNVHPTEAVEQAIRKAMQGVTPQESAQVKSGLEEYKRAEQYRDDVKAISDTYAVKLHQPVVFKLNIVNGFETELDFFDLKGFPWEVATVSTGDGSILSATKSEVMPHSVNLSTKSGVFSGRTNLKVRFEGIQTSISFPVVINTNAYHDTLKVILPGLSPVSDDQPAGEYRYSYDNMRETLDDPIARSILDNPIDPQKSVCKARSVVLRTITGQALQGNSPAAFYCNSKLYIRTRFLSGAAPDPAAIIHGSDGYRVYRFDLAVEMYSCNARLKCTVEMHR